MKRCVDCGVATQEERHENVTADVCPEGHGMWLDERELLSAVRTVEGGDTVGNAYDEGRSLRLAADRDIEPGDAVRTCPMCEREMGSVRYAFTTDVVVDVCATHGVWLDGGELEQLEAWAQRRADPESEEARERLARLHAQREDAPEVVELRVGGLDFLRAMLSRKR